MTGQTSKKPGIGAQLYSVRAFTKALPDIAETFRKIRETGWEHIQISGFGPVDPKEVAKLVKDSGLKVACTHLKWTRFLEELDAVIEEHKMWGCRHPAIGGLPGEYHTAEGLDKFLDELAPVAERLSKEDMDFSYHNHNQELKRIGEKTWLRALFDKAPPEMLKAEIDTYWIVAGGGDPAQWIRDCSGRAPVIHLKDMCVSSKREQRFAEIGEGNLNWPAILQAACDAGTECMLVEQDDCYDRDPFECLATSYRNLKAMGY